MNLQNGRSWALALGAVVLCGSGKTADRPGADLRQALKNAGLNVDYMDTGAACRTYNVLMAEGRRVAAALLPV